MTKQRWVIRGFVIVSTFVIRASSFALLVAQCFHGIEAHGRARRQITGRQSNQEKNDWDQREARRIVRGNSVETAGQKFREEERAHESDREADQNQPQALTGNEPENVAGLRAERHPHADFLRPLPDRVGHHAIKPERREEEREPREDREERPEKASVPE